MLDGRKSRKSSVSTFLSAGVALQHIDTVVIYTQQLPGGVILMEEVRVDQRRNENPILLRDEIDEKSHKLLHLKRSQEELQEMMRMIYPEEDSDLSTAYHENHSIILRIENEINELKDILIEIDAAYAIEETPSTQIPKKEFPTPNETQGIYL
jgi:hypothetical protein